MNRKALKRSEKVVTEEEREVKNNKKKENLEKIQHAKMESKAEPYPVSKKRLKMAMQCKFFLTHSLSLSLFLSLIPYLIL